jgi:hypothetical protein
MRTSIVTATFFAAMPLVGLGAIKTAMAACPDFPDTGEICTFTGPNFSGTPGSLRIIEARNPCGDNLEGTYFHPMCFPNGVIDNNTRSIIVGTNTRVRYCFDPNLSGPCQDLAAGSGSPFFVPDLGDFDNQISSFRVDSLGGDCRDLSSPSWQNVGRVAIYDFFSEDPNGDCTVRLNQGKEYSHAGLMGLKDNTTSSVFMARCTQLIICRDPNQGGVCTQINNGPFPAGIDLLDTPPIGDNQASSMEIGTTVGCM